MNGQTYALTFLATFAFAGCGAPNQAVLTAKEHAVYSAAFRHAITAYGSNGVVFLAIGDKDPPPDMLGVLRPVSRCHLANCGDRNIFGFTGESICDKVTGEPGSIVSAEIIEWIGDDRVKVKCGEFTAPLWGGGSDVFFRLKNGEWIFDGEDVKSRWVS